MFLSLSSSPEAQKLWESGKTEGLSTWDEIRFGTNSKSGELFFFTYDHQLLGLSFQEAHVVFKTCWTSGPQRVHFLVSHRRADVCETYLADSGTPTSPAPLFLDEMAASFEHAVRYLLKSTSELEAGFAESRFHSCCLSCAGADANINDAAILAKEPGPCMGLWVASTTVTHEKHDVP